MKITANYNQQSCSILQALQLTTRFCLALPSSLTIAFRLKPEDCDYWLAHIHFSSEHNLMAGYFESSESLFMPFGHLGSKNSYHIIIRSQLLGRSYPELHCTNSCSSVHVEHMHINKHYITDYFNMTTRLLYIYQVCQKCNYDLYIYGQSTNFTPLVVQLRIKNYY